VAPVRWSCELYGPDGRLAGGGDGSTATEAMAFAWLSAWAPGALVSGYVELGEVPYDVPVGCRFELKTPWLSKS
jgi:hypothetical protein